MRMRKLVAEYHQSGESLRQFSIDHGISRTKLNYWVKRFKDSSMDEFPTEERISSKFIPIDLSGRSNSESSYIIINKPCGTQIMIPL